MAAKDIKKHQFKKGESGNPNGRPKGSQNRATVFKKLLDKKIKIENPIDGQELNITMYEAAALGQIKAAMDGNPVAWKEIQDSLHGKIKDTVDLNVNVGELSDEELQSVIDSKG